ncbi:TRAP transporter permease [Halocynthiibacter namhaensis]|uniref:TRAP transporter permease n=1 Tax=Halocynthiibacter namhaensis TaxID=1290553 RepID=UPI000578E949|nr:TRAP transporter permease [Halocynthiibacter namhaensis]
MSQNTENSSALSEEELQELVASSDAGARSPAGAVGTMMAVVAIVWSLFQILLASPWAPYILPGSVINNSRLFHLSFGLFMVFLAYPLTATSPRDRIPAYDWILAIFGAAVALYGFFFYQKIVDAGGLADNLDKKVALAGLVVLFAGAWRALGPAMAVLASVFLGYVFLGDSSGIVYFLETRLEMEVSSGLISVLEWGGLILLPIIVFVAYRTIGIAPAVLIFLLGLMFVVGVPEVIQWKGASLKKAMSHMWITSEGVFGIALGVSTKFVFLFVLFGALLDKAGAGNYFIKMAFGALGHLRGGPAKAAVVGSAATGLISGSSIANVVTTGTFTIPLMKRVGFSSEKAGAVEVASSVNGQIMPPVMGAAAFLMVEYTSTPYIDVITHAFLPAAISYIALVYIVHLEAVKKNMPALGESDTSFLKMLLSFILSFGIMWGVSKTCGIAFALILSGILGLSASLTSLLAYLVVSAIAFVLIRWSVSIEKDSIWSWFASTGAFIIALFGSLFGVLYSFMQVLSYVFPGGSGASTAIILALIGGSYLGLLYLASQSPDLEADDPNAAEIKLPVVGEVYKTGLYFLLPIVVLVWFLMVEQKSPGLSAFWATALMIVMLLTQRPLKEMFRGQNDYVNTFKDGLVDLMQGLIDGARNMIGIALATATAGVIVGTVTLTGIGQVMADLVEFLSGGNLVAMLVLVGILSLILGMGLPTTANYIVVSSLMAGVVVELGAQNDLIVPLIAVHLFVFYFGIMADVTPPVGLASFAAAAVSGGDAIKTGFIAFFYSLRTVALPFVFIFNTDLLLIDVTWTQGIIVAIVSTIAILVFTAGTMGWWLTKSKIYESIALCAIAFVLFRPDYVMNRIQPPFNAVEPANLAQALGDANPGDEVRIVVRGPDFDTLESKDVTLVLPVGDETTGEERLAAFGLATTVDGDVVQLDEPFPQTTFSSKLGGFDFYGDEVVTVAAAKATAEQSPKELVFIPALIFLGLIGMLQLARARKEEGEMA